MQSHRLSVLLVLSATFAAAWSHAAAAGEEESWHVVVPVYLSATAKYQGLNGSHDRQLILAGLLEWRVRNGYRQWSIGPLVEIRFQSDDPNRSVVSPGLIFRHRHRRWDTTAVLLRQLPSHTDPVSTYGARLRYRLSPSRKLGAEIFGPLRDVGSSNLMFGLYTDLSDTVSFRLLAGTRIDQRNARSARLQFVWQVH